MAEPFLGEIRMFSGNYAPRGWALCDGQILPINQNQALFALLGNNYGGDGQTTFALPDLRGRTPVHAGIRGPIVLGEKNGEQAHTLISTEMPMHTHAVSGSSSDATEISPSNNVWATKENCYGSSTYPLTAMHGSALSTVGGSNAHNNMQPYLAVNFIIALEGIFPSRN